MATSFMAQASLPHPLNFTAGWALILCAFLVGAIVGLAFHREEYLGGYSSFRRRLLRLGHIALAALGMLNILYGLSPIPAEPSQPLAKATGLCFLLGGIAMPAVCFLTAWKQLSRHLFFIPVMLLLSGVLLMLYYSVGL